MSRKASLEPEPGQPFQTRERYFRQREQPVQRPGGRQGVPGRVLGARSPAGSQHVVGGSGVTLGKQQQERGSPGPHLRWGRSAAVVGADYGRAHRVRCRRVVDGRAGRKDGLRGEWTGLVDGLSLGVGDEKGNQGDSRVGLECPGGCWGLCAVKVRPGQWGGMWGGGRTGAPSPALWLEVLTGPAGEGWLQGPWVT